MNKTTKRILAFGLPLTVVAATGIAFAAWTATGNGNGTAQAKTLVVDVVAAAAPTADLFPGAPAGATNVKITNNNPAAIVVTAVVANGTVAGTGCTTADTTFANGTSSLTTNYNLAARTIANGASVTFTLPGTVTMGLNSTSDCQGKTLDVPVTVTETTP